MHFSDELLKRIAAEPIEVALEICETTRNSMGRLDSGGQGLLLLEAGMIINRMITNELIPAKAELPPIIEGKPQSVKDFLDFIHSVQAQLETSVARNKALQFHNEIDDRLNRLIAGSFGYELTDGDFDKIQALVNELRDLIADSDDLQDDHRTRILKRLAKVQSELNKKLSTLDSLYCLAIETSIVAGKVGKNAIPLAKAAKVIAGIAWRTHAHTEGLPSDAQLPMLGSDNTNNLID